MGLVNFLNNLIGVENARNAHGSGGATTGEGNNGPGGIGNNTSSYASVKLAPGVPSVMPGDEIYAAGGSLHGRAPMNYGGRINGGWEIAGQIRPIQGGFGDLYSFRVHAPAVPMVSMGANEIAFQIQRRPDQQTWIASAPPVPTNGWLPPALSIPFEQ